MKKIIYLLLILALASGCTGIKESLNDDQKIKEDAEVTAEIVTATEKAETTTDDSSSFDENLDESFHFNADENAEGIFTSQLVTTDLSPREWLDKEYYVYSGGWQWNFDPVVVVYGDSKYDGFLAFRDELGMYVKYVLIPEGKVLNVFRTEKNQTAPLTEEESKEIVNKLSK